MTDDRLEHLLGMPASDGVVAELTAEVIRLRADNAALRDMVDRLGTRLQLQGEVLSRRAERPGETKEPPGVTGGRVGGS